MFFLRAFVYTSAFIGAGWFGDWVYLAVSAGGWDTAFYFIIAAAVLAGALAALAAEALGARDA